MRRLGFILLFLALVCSVSAGQTNYFCIVCGKGPLTGHIWMYPRGPVCDDCNKIQERCAICGLPIKDGDGHIKTPDGRFICKFDKINVVLTLDQAKDLFEQAREDVVDIYGRQFALKYTDVTVSLFDVDYWSERQGESGLHKLGFSHTRKTSDGKCTHEVVMLSGRTREEMMSVAAHEYTHLWINENCPDSHVIDGDTVEAICELTAYKLMGQKKLPEMQKRILENPYTNGKIKTLVAVEREGGTDYVLNWVKNGKGPTLDADANLAPIPAPTTEATAPISYGPRVLPQGLKFSGIMAIGKDRQAVINGVALTVGEQKTIKLRDKSVQVRCKEIHDEYVMVELNGSPEPLFRGKEKILP
ncbi:MAG: hypothetical protein WDM76_00630 [Limisphaerales bacterium]